MPRLSSTCFLSTCLWASLLLALALTPRAWSLDDSRLWLPKEYRIHYIKLKEAALAAEALESCAEILRGTLDLDLSTPEQAYYRFLCRQPDGLTYTEIVDGVTLIPRSTAVEEPPPETPIERERRLTREAAEAEQERKLAAQRAQREADAAHLEAERERQAAEQAQLAEQKAREEAEQKAQAQAARVAAKARQVEGDQAKRRQVFHQICYSEILARTSMMMNLVWATDQLTVKELDNGQMRFHGEFDAQNIWGKKLAYKVECIISTPTEMVVVISPRTETD